MELTSGYHTEELSEEQQKVSNKKNFAAIKAMLGD
jgi:hypothetical protein